MKKNQCKEALDIYKKFLYRMTKLSEFLKVAEVPSRFLSPGGGALGGLVVTCRVLDCYSSGSTTANAVLRFKGCH